MGRSDGVREPVEGLVEIDGVSYSAVPDVDRMAPFLMSVVSDGDRWMFASSSGALTAGRRDAAGAVFPYETDDRLHAAGGRIGPVTVVRVRDETWQPFVGDRALGSRHLYKAVAGDSYIVEERRPDLGLTVTMRWASCDRFGFVRSTTITNNGSAPVEIEAVDGLVEILPAGIEPVVTQRLSNLANAYKRSELISPRLAVYTLESPVSDQAEPEEVLRATTVWSTGFPGAEIALDAEFLARFRRGEASDAATLLTGRSGSYLLHGAVGLEPGGSASWKVVIDARRDQVDVVELIRLLEASGDRADELDAATSAASETLSGIMARADAQQCTGDEVACAHHVANVTYNVMRGGVPLDGYRVGVRDLRRFVTGRNRPVAERHASWFDALPAVVDRTEAIDRARGTGDVHLLRLVREYLPFSFSRRHGDPSRPWNTFAIRVRDERGEPVIHFEGNWRDVFQNWEATCTTHPHYLPGVIALFANASTVDGFNPYRITRDGVDWEVPDPDDPWANIGYWGDHQIVYLDRLLAACERFLPGTLDAMLGEAGFTFADVPYRIASYHALVDDPKSTISFDVDADARSAARVAEIGGDGRLRVDADGRIVTATLLEKLVITTLARLSNFVPGGGVWMNTQRPEWNDANNALVGYGLSMVTTYQLRPFLERLRTLVARHDTDREVTCSTDVVTWMRRVVEALSSPAAGDVDDAAARRRFLDQVGGAFSDYRAAVSDGQGDGGSYGLAYRDIVALCDAALDAVDATIRAARRDDGLFHAYRLVEFTPDHQRVEVHSLPPMLEGQVAALSSGVLTAAERADLVETLFGSDLYERGRRTFLLAPVRHLPSFLDKNVVPADALDRAPLLRALAAEGDGSIVRTDASGVVRFHPDLVDATRLDDALRRLDAQWAAGVAEQRDTIAEVYESVFGHRSFIGRSGSMYGYEGIGSTYWHMVSKLLLAVQESVVDAAEESADPDVVARLVASYERVRDGLGFRSSAAQFGAVPTDPYSHTPAHAGAQQPGMTGAVKEELLTRPLELGIRVDEGRLGFDRVLLDHAEPLAALSSWSPIGIDGRPADVEVPAGSWALTVCQVPVVVGRTDDEPSVEIETSDGTVRRIGGGRLDPETSAQIFARNGRIAIIRAAV